ncbi:MAG: methyltransferase domain-containing protein [Nanoarchaeota archaeon]
MEDQKQYVEGLEAFFEASGENESDVNGIIEQIPKYFPRLSKVKDAQENIRVLDVGSGNGAKSMLLAERVHDVYLTKPTVDFIEPTDEQRVGLFKRLIYMAQNGKRYDGAIYPTTFKDFEPKNGTKYDMVLFLHSLYQFPKNESGIIPGLEKVRDLLSEDGCGIVVLEDYEADFQRMKRELYPKFGRTNFVNIYDVKRSFQEAGLSVKQGDKIPVNFCFDKILGFSALNDLDIGRYLSFLFSTGLEEKDLTPEQYTEAGKWVRGNLKSNGISKSYIDSTNAVLWVYNDELKGGEEK